MINEETSKQDFADEVTAFLNDEWDASRTQKARLNSLIYTHIINIARNRMLSESSCGTISVADLANEAFLKIEGINSINWKNRRHYYGAVAESMKRILIDHVRYKKRAKREAQANAIQFQEEIYLDQIDSDEAVKLSDALKDMEAMDADLATLVKLNYFAGLTVDEISNLLESSPRTIARKLKAARAWLLMQMAQ